MKNYILDNSKLESDDESLSRISNMPEIEFEKYKTAGVYHWSQISTNPKRRNPFVLAP